MECFQYLAHQDLLLRGSDHIDDNLTQLLVLRGKDNLAILERVFSNSSANKIKFKHQDYQNKLLILIAKEVIKEQIESHKKVNFLVPFIFMISALMSQIKNNYHFAYAWSTRNFVPTKFFRIF